MLRIMAKTPVGNALTTTEEYSISTIPVYQSKFSRPNDGFLFVRKTRCTTEICKIAAVSVSFANGPKRLENVSPSLFSGNEEGRVLLL